MKKLMRDTELKEAKSELFGSHSIYDKPAQESILRTLGLPVAPDDDTVKPATT